MYRLAYRNFGTHESLVVNHSVTVGRRASGVRWYELRNPGGTPTLFQQGTFSPDATSRWMGSIAMDQQGNMLLGYSASSSSRTAEHPHTPGAPCRDAPAHDAGRDDASSPGAGSQTGGLSRWGDYSAMTVDPVDDCTFWYTTEYLKTTGSFNWCTRIGALQVPELRRRAHSRLQRVVQPVELAQHRAGRERHQHLHGDLDATASRAR